MDSKQWYFKRYIPTLQVITVLLWLAWVGCVVMATITDTPYTPYTPLLIASSVVGGVFSLSVIVGIVCRW